MEWASAGILKVYQEGGPSFFVRFEFLARSCADFVATLCETGIFSPVCLSEQDSADLYQGARSFLAERAALAYLARAEHCRYQLSLKLRKKGFSDAETDPALDFLEAIGSLDDKRYAEAWLRNRSIHQSEGRRKLQAGLVSRGIPSRVADEALGDFFCATNETELCEKALEKLVRIGKTGDKIRAALARKGFANKIIEKCLKKAEISTNR